MTFNMQKARQMSARNVPTIDPYSHPATALSLACDEIDRQSASLDSAEALIRKNAERMNVMQKEINSWIADRDSWITRYQAQAKRIVDLEQKLLTSECRERDASQSISELQETLVEERTIVLEFGEPQDIDTIWADKEGVIGIGPAAIAPGGQAMMTNVIHNQCPQLLRHFKEE